MITEPTNQEILEGEATELYAIAAKEEYGFPKDFPLSYAEIQYRQEHDVTLSYEMEKSDPNYQRSEFQFGNRKYTLLTYHNKIVLPKSLQTKAVHWYYTTLLHPGEKRTLLTMGQHFTWPGMQNTVKNICQQCPLCQLHNKPKNVHYGHLPPKQAEEILWERLCIDLIGRF
jgi:Integrase zinc binding domain